jgi:uncharacterized repeat protein (TIGR03803 family)
MTNLPLASTARIALRAASAALTFTALFGVLVAPSVQAQISVSSAGAADQYKILHYFASTGYGPGAGLVADSADNLYGTTYSSNADTCGMQGCGTVFKLSRESGGKWSYTVIHHFQLSEGEGPESNLIFDSSGNLYGTASGGGASNTGTVFELSPSGSMWKVKVLYSFGNPPDVVGPWGALAFDAKGNLYGSANAGGGHGQGGIFELKRSGDQWKERLIHNFTGGFDGGQPGPVNLIWDSAGTLYGTTQVGGKYFNGVVYKLAPSSGGSWIETVLYNFTGGSDGGEPTSGVIFDANGNLYGTASEGGLKACGVGSQYYCGTVFELTPSTGKWKFSLLHAFDGTNGWSPFFGLLLSSRGSFYWTTLWGGRDNYGIVFKLSQSGDSWTEIMLQVFDLKDGSAPRGLMLGQQGTLYGTATSGGRGPVPGYGVAFSVTP